MFSYSKIHCHVVKFKKLVELHTYTNKRPKEPPTGKNLPDTVHSPARFKLKV